MSSSSSTSFTSSSSSSSTADSIDSFQTLIPGLPNDISTQIISFIPYSHHSRLKPVCKSWKHFLSSKTILNLRKNLFKSSNLLCIFPEDPSISPPYLFDFQNLSWCRLPLMPCNPHAYGLSNFTSISLGRYIYVLGGSLFDTRSYPMDRPIPSSDMFRLDVCGGFKRWERLAPMISPRGSFACIGNSKCGEILVAGGGSRHPLFRAAGSRMNSVECYNVEKDEWIGLDGLPGFRAGCVGFLVGKGDEMEFWVMGGYGESRTVSGVFPVDEYYRDGVILELRNGGKWREIGDMWGEGERRKLGNVVVVDGADLPMVFMLDGNDIFRYDSSSNRWVKESSVPRKSPVESSIGFAALDGELHVMSSLKSLEPVKNRRQRHHKNCAPLFIQTYSPERRAWRSLTTKTPFQSPLDFTTAVMCTIQL
ncbi:hypothetical protein MKW94_017148 [Papaver nudicaule]|uniref:F-box domain-containing protein n=1 Tax=Papaver nudicaule TaxID=74823 RepID=A0AA41S2X2_PAPNU|nr:hypothetical protein [Papaver nudicaule]